MLCRFALPLALITTPVLADSYVIGLGSDSFDHGPEAVSLLIETRYDVFTTVGPFALRTGAAFELDEDRDAWVGFGIFATAPLTDNLDLVTSFTPGLYERGDGQDLGGVLEFRTQLGFSYSLGKGAVGMVYEHKSNGGLYDRNPGVNSLYLTYGIGF